MNDLKYLISNTLCDEIRKMFKINRYDKTPSMYSISKDTDIFTWTQITTNVFSSFGLSGEGFNLPSNRFSFDFLTESMYRAITSHIVTQVLETNHFTTKGTNKERIEFFIDNLIG